MQALHWPPVITIEQIDERIHALHQHEREWHAGHAVQVTPMQCRERIDQLLDARHAMTNAPARHDERRQMTTPHNPGGRVESEETASTPTAQSTVLSLSAHKAESVSRQGPRAARVGGYGREHSDLRRRWAREVALGLVTCARCGESIAPSAPWDLGHDDVDRSRYVGPEHAACNRATAGRGRRVRPSSGLW